MCIFKGFKDEGPTKARFLVNGRLEELTKQETLELHEKNKSLPSPKGSNPDSEQTKFALDRWPDTELGKRIANNKK